MLLKLLLVLLILVGCSVVVRKVRKRKKCASVAPAERPFAPPPRYLRLVPLYLRFLFPYQERCAGFRVLPAEDTSWVPSSVAYIQLIDFAMREGGASVVIPHQHIPAVLECYGEALVHGHIALDEEALIGEGEPARLIVHAYPSR